jgi:tetratricopeptide (TPR) repeat protein
VLKCYLDKMNYDYSFHSGEKINALGAMVKLRRAQGRYDEAMEHYLKMLKMSKNMKTNHQEADMSIINNIVGYAEILCKDGDFPQAEVLHMRARYLLLQSKSKTDLHLATSQTQLGCTLYAFKNYKDALQEHQSSLRIWLRDLEISNALVSESFNYCVEMLCGMGHHDDVLPLSL